MIGIYYKMDIGQFLKKQQPKVRLVDTTMVGKVIPELKSVSRLKILRQTKPMHTLKTCVTDLPDTL